MSNQEETPTLIEKTIDGNRITYLVDYRRQKFQVIEMIDNGTHTLIALSTGGPTPPTNQEENTLVVFIKTLNDAKNVAAGTTIIDVPALPKSEKPWGTEVLLSSFPQYVMKSIRITPGHRTSLQFHHEKYETLVFVSGKGIVYYRNKNNELAQIDVVPNMVVEFSPNTPHRVQAITELRYFEASTPEIPNDTVRLEDDYGR